VKGRKIIHIDYRAYDSCFPPKSSPYYYLAGWSSAVARQTLRYTSAYLIENWRPEREVIAPVVREVEGIVCRLFPAKYVRHFRDWSPAMLRELRKQSLEHDILVHHSSIHSNSLYLIALLFRNTPIVAQHHGDYSSRVRFSSTMRHKAMIAGLLERALLKGVDHFFVLNKSEMSFLESFLPRSRITQQTMGVNFDEFKPINKATARNKLGIPRNRKVMLYVGKFYQLKGVDLVLKTYAQLRTKHDIDLILVGGSTADPLYREVKSSGARSYDYLPHEELPFYYSAADVYLMPAFSHSYWGIDVATIESLACGVPVVSPILKDYPHDIRDMVGRIPQCEDDIARCVSDIFTNPGAYSQCRQAARKHFDWELIIKNTVAVYERLFAEYYA
jgi:glycosyltransferase involved in cell wall biosynthesis